MGFLIEFWPSLEVSVRYHFPARAHGIQSRLYSKAYFNTDCVSYDFWVSVCLEVSVWNCLFGGLTDTLDSQSSIFRFSCPRCLLGAVCLFVCMPVCVCLSTNIIYMFLWVTRRGQLKSFRFYDLRCGLSIIFPHRLVGFETDTSKHTSSEAFLEVSVRYHFPAQARRKRIQTLRASPVFILKI